MRTQTVLTAAALAATLLSALPATTMAATPASATATATAGPTARAGTQAPPSAAAAGPRTRLGACGPGQLCLWPKPDFGGKARTHELSDTDIDSCVPLPPGATALALANRTGRPVTTYQSAECAETGAFETYPGDGTWVPQSPHQVRAFKIWER
ncbi:peptidase inhibitor family I36 protein [Streptomyces sp. NPDC048577]|uniref:peptidase inhibitor family I36 protein n=1 Tax=Streptomyces sp. NPDC048577 TaxID=3157209 RepID=UPI003414096A